MSKLHDALTSLGPIEPSAIPFHDSDAVRKILADAELIVNSIPTPADGKDTKPIVIQSTPNTATNAHQTLAPSNAIPNLPVHHNTDAALQKAWAKPLKLSTKENPLGVSVYKLAGNDRHGAWFARKSLHVGIGFTKFKRAMEREFLESMKIVGGPGAGAVRGIAGDNRLEKQSIEGLAKLEVWQLSSAFPGPVAPREFVSLVITSENALTEASAYESETGQDGEINKIPRHFALISRPTTHRDAPDRPGLVKGNYESVEMIREIPMPPTANMHGSYTSSEHDSELNPVEWIMITRSDPGGGIPRFMVERGTPGSIVADVPKFMDWACSKGDLSPLDEDIKKGEIPEEARAFENPENGESSPAGSRHAQTAATPEISTTTSRTQSTEHASDATVSSNIFSYLGSAVPASVQDYIPYFQKKGVIPPEETLSRSSSTSSSATQTSSLFSFTSAAQFNTAEEIPLPEATAPADSKTKYPRTDSQPQHPDLLVPPAAAYIQRSSTTSLPSDQAISLSSSTSIPNTTLATIQNQHHRDLAKLDAKRRTNDEHLAKAQELHAQRLHELSEANDAAAEEVEGVPQSTEAAAAGPAVARPLEASPASSTVSVRPLTPNTTQSLAGNPQSPTPAQKAARSALDKAAAALTKAQAQHAKDAAKTSAAETKLLSGRDKALQKAEAKARKLSAKRESERIRVELREMRELAKQLEREKKVLLDRVEALQRENTTLVARYGGNAGEDKHGALAGLMRDEAAKVEGRSRGSSRSSLRAIKDAVGSS